MTMWLSSVYLLVTVVLLAAGIIQYKPDRPVPSDENKDAARRILLSWVWPIHAAVEFTRWWIATVERLWIDAQWPTPSWLQRVENHAELINADGTPAQHSDEGTPVDDVTQEPQAVTELMADDPGAAPRGDSDEQNPGAEQHQSLPHVQQDVALQDTSEIEIISSGSR